MCGHINNTRLQGLWIRFTEDLKCLFICVAPRHMNTHCHILYTTAEAPIFVCCYFFSSLVLSRTKLHTRHTRCGFSSVRCELNWCDNGCVRFVRNEMTNVCVRTLLVYSLVLDNIWEKHFFFPCCRHGDPCNSLIKGTAKVLESALVQACYTLREVA